MRKYKCGRYLRLSKEDEVKKMKVHQLLVKE